MTSDRIRVIDSHTGGEPTRIVIDYPLPLGTGRLSERLNRFRSEYDRFRSAIVNEPRGSDAVVGGMLCKPTDPSCVTGVIFFNNIGYLGMCGHGTIGLMTTLAHLGRITTGVYKIETPVGIVQAELHPSGEITVANVPSYRWLANVSVEVKGYGTVTGDVAWGGNWFLLTDNCPLQISLPNLDRLTDHAWCIRQALAANGVTGKDGAEIDHIELFGPPSSPDYDSKNFVLCPGKSYDRSACGTGTSAKMACLYAAGKLVEGQLWKQESMIGSSFEGYVKADNQAIYPFSVLPFIKGSAFVNAESTLLLNVRDPFQWGIRLASDGPD